VRRRSPSIVKDPGRSVATRRSLASRWRRSTATETDQPWDLTSYADFRESLAGRSPDQLL